MEIESIKKVYVTVFYIIIINKSMCREWFLKDDWKQILFDSFIHYFDICLFVTFYYEIIRFSGCSIFVDFLVTFHPRDNILHELIN